MAKNEFTPSYRKPIILLVAFLIISTILSLMLLTSFMELSHGHISMEKCRINCDHSLLNVYVEWHVNVKVSGEKFFFVYPLYPDKYHSPDNIKITINNREGSYTLSENKDKIEFQGFLSEDRFNLIRITFEQYLKGKQIVIPAKSYGNIDKKQGQYQVIFTEPVAGLESEIQPVSVKNVDQGLELTFHTFEDTEDFIVSWDQTE